MQPIIQLDLHGMKQEEAIKCIDRALDRAGTEVYQLHLIHGFHRGTSLRDMIRTWYKYDTRVKRIANGDNPGVTVLVLKELY